MNYSWQVWAAGAAPCKDDALEGFCRTATLSSAGVDVVVQRNTRVGVTRREGRQEKISLV